ncbi:HHLA2 protein, partial [Penelope pileata]|nr:HHLA2 protein [Penelope pileata]
EEAAVTGLFSKDVILPCLFPPDGDEVIYWKKGNKDVHSYYYRQDQLGNQHLDYRNRTHLFYENIPHGNASLKLSNLNLSDEGRYDCYVGTTQTKTEVEVMLHVRVRSCYAMEYRKTDAKRMLICSAFLTYPTPNVTWVRGNTSIQETGREETRDGVLSSVRSNQDIINTSDTYFCHIHLPHEDWTAEWSMQDQLSKAEGSNAVIPCEYSSNTLRTDGFSVAWKLNKNEVVSVLASFNGTFHSYQPRVQMNENNFSLHVRDLTVDDGGDYLCNISTPSYTKLCVTPLQV